MKNFMTKRELVCRWMWPTVRAMLTCRTIYLTASGSCWTPPWAGSRSSTPSVTLLLIMWSCLSSKLSAMEIRGPPVKWIFQDSTEDPVLHVQHCVPLHDDVNTYGARLLYASRLRSANWSNARFSINHHFQEKKLPSAWQLFWHFPCLC